jgi:hypothetical protein
MKKHIEKTKKKKKSHKNKKRIGQKRWQEKKNAK